MAKIIDGKAVAAQVRAEVAEGVRKLQQEKGITPGLAVVRVGEDAASQVYVKNKIKGCAEVGIHSVERHLPVDSTQAEVIAQIEALNRDPAVHGILVQLPLPKHLNADEVVLAVDPAKDADGLHPMNSGNLLLGRPAPRACTPHGVMRLLDEAGFELRGKRAVVVGRSNIVGKPMALMLLARDATVTLCHSKTPDLPGVVRQADLVVAAVGRAELVKGDWIKEGAVVIDVGTNRSEQGTLVGDVEFAEAEKRASAITPVPGGVGPMTVAMLLANTLEAARRLAG